MTSACRIQPSPSRLGWRGGVAWFAGGFILYVASVGALLAVYARLSVPTAGAGDGFLPTDAVAFSLWTGLVIFPLVGLWLLETPGGGAAQLGLAGAGWSLGGALSALGAQVPVAQVLIASALALAFVFLLQGAGYVPCILPGGKSLRHLRIVGGGVFLLSSLWWSRPLTDLITDPAQKDLAKSALAYAAVPALVTQPIDAFDYAFLPRTYGIWYGPIAPYPPSPLAALALYSVAAGALWTFAVLWRRRSTCACS